MDLTIPLALLLVAVLAFLLGRYGIAARGAIQNGPGVVESPPDAPPILELAARVRSQFGHPRELLEDPALQNGIRLLEDENRSSAELATYAYASGRNPPLACMALEVLRRRGRDEKTGRKLLGEVGRVNIVLLDFYLRALPALLPERPLVGEVLTEIVRYWDSQFVRSDALMADILRDFAVRQIGAGEQPSVEGRLADVDKQDIEDLEALLDRLDVAELKPIQDAVRGWLATRIDEDFLRGVGKVWSDDDARTIRDQVIVHDAMTRIVGELLAVLADRRPRSALLLGEGGVGKSVVARATLLRMREEGWTVFEAGSVEIQAGQVYIGEMEARLQELVSNIDSRRRIVWYVPDFANLAWVGRHRYSPRGAIDFLLPYLERGEIVVLGESQPGAFEQLSRLYPGCAAALHCVRLEPIEEKRTLELAREWLRKEEHRFQTGKEPVLTESVLLEAWQLADQYLRDRAAPGNLFRLLDKTLQRLRKAAADDPEGASRSIDVDELIFTLSGLTGLPASILDDRQDLDLDSLRLFFESELMGQPEAIDCLVDRVAMIKAGVTDPTRPAGVFLFAGPTGTGKTQIAKTLASFLFGSEQRMIRLDMSELQTTDALYRILGEVGHLERDNRHLAEAIRKQPFSVVLLDEFEKADPPIWDLFLQVFDDGRLTDRRGVTADFRHAIIILTSNLGARIPTGTSLGFMGGEESFRPETVRREIERAFPREFVNRLDRIVVFRPLGRDTMREILRREIDLALQRRGLRRRSWAVEWEDQALDFLLERGFTADLGARPLKRAVERYFLTPLAKTIVNHQYPRGDQFLFVRTDGQKLDVVFVDPDAADLEEEPVDRAAEEPESVPSLEAMVLRPKGTSSELVCLESHLEGLVEVVDRETWHDRKIALMSRMSEAGFWNSEQRFRVLGDAEYLDRIESGLARSRSLLTRLTESNREKRLRHPRDLIGSLAQQLYLLEAATLDVREQRPRDAFVEVDAGYGAGRSTTQRDAFAHRVGEMYRNWSRKRGMQLQVLEEAGGDGRRPYRLLLAVSGYGAYSILAPEDGLHVHEIPEGQRGRAFRKCAVHVRVAPQPDVPPAVADDRQPLIALRAQALEALGRDKRESLTIVRRYRDLPSPLIRDDVRGWRTGLSDLVLGGDFDVMTGSSHVT